MPVIISLFVTLLSCSMLAAESTDDFNFEPKPIDGVTIEAVETYHNPQPSELVFGLGAFPLNEYFNGFSLTGGYMYYFNKTYAWEVINGSFIYSVDTDITSQLAEKFGVNPESIERLNFIVSSNITYTLAYGKFVFLKEYVKYFRFLLIGGLGVVSTSTQNAIAPVLGFRMDVQVTKAFSFKIDLRDNVAMASDIENHVGLTLATGYSF